MIIYYNGTFIEDGPIISPLDRGFTLGDGIFDTLLVNHGHIQNAKEHFQRLLDHAAILGIKISLTLQQWKKAINKLLVLNTLQQNICTIRTTITRGIAPRGLTIPCNLPTTTLIQASIYHVKTAVEKVKATVAERIRRNDLSFLSRIKALNYSENIIALKEAKEQGFDDAIFLNTKGFVTCSTAANIFAYKNGQLFTPQISDGIINGITRKVVLRHFNVLELSINEKELFSAQFVFLTNSLDKFRIVTQINDTVFHCEQNLVKKLQNVLFANKTEHDTDKC